MQDMKLNFFSLSQEEQIYEYHSWLMKPDELTERYQEVIISEMEVFLEGDSDEIKKLAKKLKSESRRDFLEFYIRYTKSWKKAMEHTFDALLFPDEESKLPITYNTYLYAREQFILWVVRQRAEMYDYYPFVPVKGLEVVQYLPNFRLPILSESGEEIILFLEKPAYYLCGCHGVLTFGKPDGSYNRFELLLSIYPSPVLCSLN